MNMGVQLIGGARCVNENMCVLNEELGREKRIVVSNGGIKCRQGKIKLRDVDMLHMLLRSTT